MIEQLQRLVCFAGLRVNLREQDGGADDRSSVSEPASGALATDGAERSERISSR